MKYPEKDVASDEFCRLYVTQNRFHPGSDVLVCQPIRKFTSKVPYETQEQRALVRKLRQSPCRIRFHSNMEGVRLGGKVRNSAKAEGMEKGVADLHILRQADNTVPFVTLEMKRLNGKLSDVRETQWQFLYDYYVAANALPMVAMGERCASFALKYVGYIL